MKSLVFYFVKRKRKHSINLTLTREAAEGKFSHGLCANITYPDDLGPFVEKFPSDNVLFAFTHLL